MALVVFLLASLMAQIMHMHNSEATVAVPWLGMRHGAQEAVLLRGVLEEIAILYSTRVCKGGRSLICGLPDHSSTCCAAPLRQGEPAWATVRDRYAAVRDEAEFDFHVGLSVARRVDAVCMGGCGRLWQ